MKQLFQILKVPLLADDSYYDAIFNIAKCYELFKNNELAPKYL